VISCFQENILDVIHGEKPNFALDENLSCAGLLLRFLDQTINRFDTREFINT